MGASNGVKGSTTDHQDTTVIGVVAEGAIEVEDAAGVAHLVLVLDTDRITNILITRPQIIHTYDFSAF